MLTRRGKTSPACSVLIDMDNLLQGWFDGWIGRRMDHVLNGERGGYRAGAKVANDSTSAVGRAFMHFRAFLCHSTNGNKEQ